MGYFSQYDELLSSQELELVARAHRFCTGEFSQAVRAAHLRGVPFPMEWINKWAAEGMLGLQAKQEHGGRGASYPCKVRIAEEMALHSFAAAFAMNNLQGTVTRISNAASPQLQDQLLEGMLGGEILGAPALTEPAGGSDLAALATSARPVDGGWLVNGTKSWITNGLIVNCLVLLARMESAEDDNNIAGFVVRLQDEKTFVRHEIPVQGARSFRLADITFRDHFVPSDALLYRPGEAFKALMTSVNAARVHVAAMCTAALFSALTEATRYCEQRRAFGKPLLAHQGLRWELAEVATQLEAAHALVLRAVMEINRGHNSLTLAAQTKKFAVDTAIWGVDRCVRAMGAVGASDLHRLCMAQSEVRMAAYADGTNEMLLDRIGRNLANEYPGS